jgi:rhombotail lipoprotein
MTRLRSLPLLVLAGLLLLGSMACIGPETRARRSSLMGYLYPQTKGAPAPAPAGAVALKLPLKLGIAFVPAGSGSWDGAPIAAPGSEKPLLDVVKGTFKGRPWVSEIRIIPSAYLRPGGGFENLEQVSRMFGVDVVALVSVDQIQYSDPRWYSFTYLSIVGAFVLPGNLNDTRTLIDAAVFHPGSRAFLLRAPGQSLVRAHSTPVALDELLRRDAGEGLKLAMEDLARNLDREVGSFKEEVAKGERPGVDLIDREGRSLTATGGRNWGGSFTLLEALAGLALVAFAARRRH